MSEVNRHIIFNPTGSSQRGRQNAALGADYIRVDERSLADLLAFIYRFSEKVKFYGPDNKVSGTWQSLFEADISVLLACISSKSILDVEGINDRYRALLNQLEDEVTPKKKILLFHQLFGEIFDLVKSLDKWFDTALRNDTLGDESELSVQIQNAVDYRLKGKVKELIAAGKGFNETEFEPKLEIDISGFDQVWGLDKTEIKPNHHMFEGSNIDERVNHAAKHLTFIFEEFLRTVRYLTGIAPRILKDSLENDPYHAPQNALLITFLKLYEHVKGDLNSITKKHLDYYFFNRLKQNYEDAKADRVHLHFTLAEHVGRHTLEKGTLLVAGTDEEGIDYLYKTDHDLELNKAVVSDVKVLYISKNPLITEGDAFKLISNIYKADIASAPKGGIDFEAEPMAFDTFGKEEYESRENDKVMVPATVGFAVTSPVLLLREGLRTIDLYLKFNIKSLSSLVSFLEDFTKKEKMTAEGAFHKIFARAFKVMLSHAEGWHTVEDYKVIPPEDWTSGNIRISFNLGLGDPPVEPLDEANPDYEAYKAQWPTLKFVLSREQSMYAYSYLRDLVVEECEIKVNVEKIKQLEVYNNIGKLDISSPFFPFGTTPMPGSYLLIGYDELYKKTVTDLKINLNWHNLPRGAGGFKEYYKKYDQKINNASFKVGLQALSGYEFFPKQERKIQQFDLFRTAKTRKGEVPAEKVQPETALETVDVELLQMENDYAMEELPEYDNAARSGYLKLELTAPEMGFGHDVYPTLFAREVMESSKGKNAIELPNPPYAPQLRSLNLSYKAATGIIMNKASTRRSDPDADEKVYHIHPFGIATIFKEGIPDDNHLLPQFDDEGYLLMGLRGLRAGDVVTLYFILEHDIGNDFEVDLPQIRWHYLSNNRWITMDKDEVIFDTTGNFTVSGIVKLHLPIGITDQNDILPKNRFWISASAKGEVSLLSRTRAIYTQALSATWIPHKEGAQWITNIPAGTIARLVTSRSEIAAIHQPAPSFSGEERENEAQFYARVSERLRHKYRAVTSWDYEHLILEKFPFIGQVKCLGNMDQSEKIQTGEVLIVVVPKVRQQREFYQPKFNYHVLYEIERYVNRLNSSFIQARVINPVYEQVKITCRLKFIDNANSGEYLQSLHTDVMKFMCPWFYYPEREMVFGAEIKREELLSFIYSRDYVKFVTKLAIVIVHYESGTYALSDSYDDDQGKILYASTPWSVLVPFEQHDVSILEKEIHETPEKAAIENMRLGADFVVAEETFEEEEAPTSGRRDDDNAYYAIEIDLDL